MDPTLQNNKPNFPNSDQPIPGVIDANRPQPEEYIPRRPTVNVLDALRTQKEEDPSTQRLHTFQEDIAKTIKDDNVSMIKMAMAEKKRQEEQGIPEEQADENSEKSKKYVTMGVILLVALVILGGTGFVMARLSKSTSPYQQLGPAKQVSGLSLLFTESKANINVDGKDSIDAKKAIKKEISKSLQLGSMKAILLVTGTSSPRELTTEEFLNGLQTNAGEPLIRSLESYFLFGAYYFNSDETFLMMKVSSYDNAFAAMLQWEPDMEIGLGSIFIKNLVTLPPTPVKQVKQAPPPDPEGVYLAGEEPEPEEPVEEDPFAGENALKQNRRTWVDRVVNNKDSRVLVDSNGNIAMLYTFLDKQTLVITSGEKSLKEIMFRLTTGRVVR